MGTLKRGLYWVLPMALLGAALAVHLRAPALVEALRLQVFDAYQRIEPRPYEPMPVKIVDIDDESLDRLGQWPWPRSRLAELVDVLHHAGAAVIALDFIFAEPDRTSPANIIPLWGSAPAVERLRRELGELPDHDAMFAEAIARANVVMGIVLTHTPGERLPEPLWTLEVAGGNPRPFLPQFSGAIMNLPALERGAAGRGTFNLVPESDGIVRRIHLLLALDDALYPALAAELLRVAQQAAGYAVHTAAGRGDPERDAVSGIEEVSIGGLAVPTDHQGRMWLHFTEFTPERYVPAWQVFDPAFNPASLAGHIVLIGTSAAGLKDLRPTPLNPATAGVEVHASIVEQVLLGHFLRRPGWIEAAELIYVVVLSLILVLPLPRLGSLVCAVAGLLAVILAAGFSWYAFTEMKWLVDPVLPSLAVLLVYLAGSLINYVQTESERRQIRSAFSHYLAPSVVEQLIADPSRLSLGGEKRETTFLFTDIAGFTSLTERMDPTILVRLLNEYLEATCRIVLDNGGTIDKIVGDALHVMFNAPSDQPDHAERAVRCALELDQFCRGYETSQAEQGITVGETRIGINTGVTVVGNFGGATRFDYTAHGDAINTAARLEGVNKYLGTRICVSETTIARCGYPYVRPIGRLVLKGKTEGLGTFEPIPEAEFESPKTADYLRAYELLEHADGGVADAFASLAKRYPEDALIAFHANRLATGETGATIVMAEK